MDVTASFPRLSKKAFICIAVAALAFCSLFFLTGCKNSEGGSDKNINLTVYSNESLGFSVKYNGDFQMIPDSDGFPVEQTFSKKSEDAKGTIKLMYYPTGDAETWVNEQCRLAASGAYGTLQEGTDTSKIVAGKMKFKGHDAYAANFVTMENGTDYLGQYLIADNIEGGGIFAYYLTFNPNGFEVTSVELERVMTYMRNDPHAYDNE